MVKQFLRTPNGLSPQGTLAHLPVLWSPVPDPMAGKPAAACGE